MPRSRASGPRARPAVRATTDPWLEQYAASHQHPVNRWCHTFGIPMILAALPAAVLRMWTLAVALWVAGWCLQFAGHAVEGKPPEFFRDWRFLFVGLRWWIAKMRGRI
jgi:uncharacterized membrane protein YGL010W